MNNECYGIYAGQVSSVKDPEKRGRIKVICPEITGESATGWCEPCIPVAQDFHGDFCIPHIGEYVWIAFESGDVNSPVYLGGWWQKNKTVLGENYFTQDNHKRTRTINFHNATLKFFQEEDSISSITLETKNSNNEDTLTFKMLPDNAVLNIQTQNNNFTMKVGNSSISIVGDVHVTGDIILNGISLKNYISNTDK